MIESIKIKNLRGIRQGALLELSPLVVLAGPNGCGKSTVLDALLIGASPVPGDAIGRTVLRRKGLINGARWLAWRADEAHPISVEVFDTDKRRRKTKLVFEQRTTDVATELKCDVFSQHVSTEPFRVQFVDSQNHYEYEKRDISLHPSSDMRFVEPYAHESVPLQALYTRAVEQGRRKQACEIVQAVVPSVQDIEILVEGDTPIVHLVYDDCSIPAAIAGDGVQSLLRLSLELAARPRGVVLLEEPEAHQHPAAIRQSVRAILAATQREIQVILTTHSLEFLDTLLAEAGPEDLERLSLYRVRLEDGELLSSRLAGEEVARARQEVEDDLR